MSANPSAPSPHPGTNPVAAQPAPVGPGPRGPAAGPAEAAAPAAALPSAGGSETAFVAGGFQSSGDWRIDRMLQLEQALKRFGSPF